MRWSNDDIDWSLLDAPRADANHIRLARAACLVEANAADYVTYLHAVFADDAEFCNIVTQWGEEEVQHGKALAAWAERVAPDFDADAALARFKAAYQLPQQVSASVRGSRSGELVARCMVEVGTSSYYASLAASSDEPVFREICRRIAADELRHYKLFYDHLKRYLGVEKLSRWQRLRIALGRIAESEDDELACAYWAANADATEPYSRKIHGNAYLGRAAHTYQEPQMRRAVAMIFKACGFAPPARITDFCTALFAWGMRRKAARHLPT